MLRVFVHSKASVASGVFSVHTVSVDAVSLFPFLSKTALSGSGMASAYCSGEAYPLLDPAFTAPFSPNASAILKSIRQILSSGLNIIFAGLISP